MKILTKLTGICLFLLAKTAVFAQDIELTNLTSNPAVTYKYNELKKNGALNHRSIIDTMDLSKSAFVDDFSYPGPFPDPKLWLDKYVFINRTYAYSPPSIGVATFDGLNEKGYPYDFTASESSSAGADTLTSVPLDLSFATVADSVSLTFQYQPQGLGNSPAARDSLVVEFKAPGGNWNNVWSKSGNTLVFKDTMDWAKVKILIVDPIYLKKGFQFRFRNYATVSGSFDHWHIDYVFLGKPTVKSFTDYTYVYNHPSLLKKYTTMPWRQYEKTYNRDSVCVFIKNNTSSQTNIARNYNIRDENGNLLKNIIGKTNNVDPFLQKGYLIDTISDLPKFPTLTKPTSFFIETNLTITKDSISRNDTLRAEQKFGIYYAYDDGTAESAFGLKKANSSVAIKFDLAVQDTLRYVDIYFNPKLTDATKTTFHLKVWNDTNGQPGAELVSSQAFTPGYTKTGLNNILRYPFDEPLILPPGNFYVGFFQEGNVPNNVGLDMNTNNQFNTFYKSGLDDWNTMPYPGSAIIHPVFGRDTTTVVGIENLESDNNFVNIYPNPATSYLTVQSKSAGSHQLTYTIVDLFGREIENKKITTPSSVDVSELKNGIYFIRFQENESNATLKFIKIE